MYILVCVGYIFSRYLISGCCNARRSIALLDFDGDLVTMEMGSGEVKGVAEGVESVVDLSVSASAAAAVARGNGVRTGVERAWRVCMARASHPFCF